MFISYQLGVEPWRYARNEQYFFQWCCCFESSKNKNFGIGSIIFNFQSLLFWILINNAFFAEVAHQHWTKKSWASSKSSKREPPPLTSSSKPNRPRNIPSQYRKSPSATARTPTTRSSSRRPKCNAAKKSATSSPTCGSSPTTSPAAAPTFFRWETKKPRVRIAQHPNLPICNSDRPSVPAVEQC